MLNKPLIAWTIEQANNCEIFDKVYVSTEDEEIAFNSLEPKGQGLASTNCTSANKMAKSKYE